MDTGTGHQYLLAKASQPAETQQQESLPAPHCRKRTSKPKPCNGDTAVEGLAETVGEDAIPVLPGSHGNRNLQVRVSRALSRLTQKFLKEMFRFLSLVTFYRRDNPRLAPGGQIAKRQLPTRQTGVQRQREGFRF